MEPASTRQWSWEELLATGKDVPLLPRAWRPPIRPLDNGCDQDLAIQVEMMLRRGSARTGTPLGCFLGTG